MTDKKDNMSKNLHKRLRELQRVAALHQNQAATAIGGVPQNAVIADDNSAVVSNTAMAIGTPEHYHAIRRDLVFLMVVLISMVALLLVCWWLVGHTALASWIIRAGSAIR